MSKRELADERQVLGNFAKRLKQCREDAGLNKKELAKIAGVSIGNITRYEIADHFIISLFLLQVFLYLFIQPLLLSGIFF